MKWFSFFLWIFFYAIDANACAVCFGDPNSPLTKSVGFGVWVLIGFITLVLTLFAILFFNFRKRMKKLSNAV